MKPNMRFEKGAQVEVLSMKKSASGSWRCAEIVAANRDGYTVRYYRGPGVYSESVEKVSFDVVRPCPPSVKGLVAWSVGDVVEVLDCGYWRTAVIEEVLDGGGYYFIHAVGSIDEFRVGKSSIRMRLELRDNKWVPLEKDAKIGKDIMSKTCMRISPQRQCEQKAAIPRSRKRPLLCSSPRDKAFAETIEKVSEPSKLSSPQSSNLDEDITESVFKRRRVGKHEVVCMPEDAYSFVGKVDHPVIPMICPGKDCVVTEINKSGLNCRNQDYHAGRLANTSAFEDCDSVSVVSSVGSCVGTVNVDRILSHSLTGCSEDSDAESSYMGDDDDDDDEVATSHLERVDDQSSHEKSLYMYRSTLESLFASGPLTWDLEAFLTDLRMRLLVSNDEHLLELRRLKSVGDMWRLVSLLPYA